MSLSPEMTHRLQEVREKQFRNARNKDTLQIIANRAVSALIGPVDAGKTTLALLATEIAPEEFHYVPSHTTREERSEDIPGVTVNIIPNDDDHLEQIIEDIQHGKLVQYAIHPTEHTFYGTYAEDYAQDRYNLIPMLAGRPAGYLLGSPFQSARAIGIVSSPSALEHRIKKDYDNQPEKLGGRLQEGIESADYLIDGAKANRITLIQNVEGEPKQSAEALIEAAKGERDSDPESVAYLERTREMLKKILRTL